MDARAVACEAKPSAAACALHVAALTVQTRTQGALHAALPLITPVGPVQAAAAHKCLARSALADDEGTEAHRLEVAREKRALQADGAPQRQLVGAGVRNGRRRVGPACTR